MEARHSLIHSLCSLAPSTVLTQYSNPYTQTEEKQSRSLEIIQEDWVERNLVMKALSS